MEKNFEYFMVYGDVRDLPLAVIHKENVPDKNKALELANKILSKRDIGNIRLEDVSEKQVESKISGKSEVNYLYYESSHIDVTLIGSQPAIIIYPCTDDKKSKGVGYTFMDDKAAEEFMRKAIEVYMLYKKRIKH